MKSNTYTQKRQDKPFISKGDIYFIISLTAIILFTYIWWNDSGENTKQNPSIIKNNTRDSIYASKNELAEDSAIIVYHIANNKTNSHK